jgi:hypothetical protein
MCIFRSGDVSVKPARLRSVASVARGGSMARRSSRSRSTIACSASPVALSCKVSGSASSQAAYSACKATSTATASYQRRARLRRSAARRYWITGRAAARAARCRACRSALVMGLSPRGLGGMRSYSEALRNGTGVVNRALNWLRSSAVDAGCHRSDRCGGRCGPDGRGWRRHRSGRQSRRAICRPGSGW